MSSLRDRRNDMKILVTGATGFIGHHVVQWLVDHDYDVVATGTSREKAKRFPWYNSVKFIPCDYFSINLDYYTYFENPEIIIHLGWKNAYDNSVHNQLEVNLPQTINFLQKFMTHDNIKIVGMGSSHEYGTLKGCLEENVDVNPNNPYGIAKDSLRRYIQIAAEEYGFSWNWIRQFYLLGDGQNRSSFQGQLEQAITTKLPQFGMSGGVQLRDFIPVEIAAEYISKIALQNKISGVVNCCTGTPQSLRDIALEYIHQKKSEMELQLGYYPYRKNEIMEQWGDNSLLKRCIEVYDGSCQ